MTSNLYHRYKTIFIISPPLELYGSYVQYFLIQKSPLPFLSIFSKKVSFIKVHIVLSLNKQVNFAISANSITFTAYSSSVYTSIFSHLCAIVTLLQLQYRKLVVHESFLIVYQEIILKFLLDFIWILNFKICIICTCFQYLHNFSQVTHAW